MPRPEYITAAIKPGRGTLRRHLMAKQKKRCVCGTPFGKGEPRVLIERPDHAGYWLACSRCALWADAGRLHPGPRGD